MLFLILFAFLAGVVTTLSPCVLPVLPAILSASLSGGQWRPLGVIIGLMFSFAFFTLALTTLVQQFGFSANFLHYTAIIMIGFFGMTLILPFLSDWFAKLTSWVGDLGQSAQLSGKSKKSGFLSGFILGTALGLVWTPCAGLILAAITTLFATHSITLFTVLMTLSYSLGAGLPLLAIAYGGKKAVSVVPFLSKYSECIRQSFGWIMLVTAVALGFNLDTAFQQKVLEYLPSIKIENSARVQEELNKLRPPPVGFPNAGGFNNGALSDEVDGVDASHLPMLAKAPEIVGIADWINSPPLTIAELKGKVVLIDFWTYSCINCIRTFPYLIHWNDTYKDKGLVIIGVHTPEFEFEKNLDNVKKAVERFHIAYPVALDNRYKTWQAYQNSYWPAHYLIDQNGIIRQVHLGEEGYLATENAIRSLLGEAPITKEPIESHLSNKPMTPETYLGYERGGSYANGIQIIHDKTIDYSFKQALGEDKVGINGLWNVKEEYIVSESDESSLDLNFLSGHVYLVLGGESALPISVDLDGKPLPKEYYTKDMDEQGRIFVKDARKYDVIDLQNKYGRYRLTLHIPKGIQAYAFTFGVEEPSVVIP